MFIREFVSGRVSPGTLVTGSLRKPFVGQILGDGDPTLPYSADVKQVKDYTDYEYPVSLTEEPEYGLAWAHFYGFGELMPSASEATIGTGEFDWTLNGQFYADASIDTPDLCYGATLCGNGIVFLGNSCDTGRPQAVGQTNKPYVYSPPTSPLSWSSSAGGEENTYGTQNLELAGGGYLSFKMYYDVEPVSGPKSGEAFLDNTQENPSILIDGDWESGSTAEATIASAGVYDPSSFSFVAIDPGELSDDPDHPWEDDFKGTPVVLNSDDIKMYLRSWPLVAKISSDYAELSESPSEYNMSYYGVDTSVTVRGTGLYSDSEVFTRQFTWTRFRLAESYPDGNPLIMPWGEPSALTPAADPPGYEFDDEIEDIGCRSCEQGGINTGAGITTCIDSIKQYLGFSLYMTMDESFSSYLEKFGSYYIDDFTGLYSWINFVSALHEYELDVDNGEYFSRINCVATDFSVSTSSSYAEKTDSGTQEYLFENSPEAAFSGVWSCGVDGWGVIWPTLDLPNSGDGPPDEWGCDDYLSVGIAECDMPLLNDSSIKMVTEAEERTWDFLDYSLYDGMVLKSESNIVNELCELVPDRRAWHYCACRCGDCGDFFFVDFLYYDALVNLLICGPSEMSGGVEIWAESVDQSFDLTSQIPVTTGWWKLQLYAPVLHHEYNLLRSYWYWYDDGYSVYHVCDDDSSAGNVLISSGFSILLKNADTDREGTIPLSTSYIIPGMQQAAYGTPTNHNIECDESSSYFSYCVPSIYSDVFQTTFQRISDMSFESPNSPPIAEMEPNSDYWSSWSIEAQGTPSVISSYLSCGDSEDWLGYWYGTIYNDYDEYLAGITCSTEPVDRYCRPLPGRDVHPFGFYRSMSTEFSVTFRGFS